MRGTTRGKHGAIIEQTQVVQVRFVDWVRHANANENPIALATNDISSFESF